MSPLRPSCQCTLCFGRTFLFLSVNEAGTFTVHDQHSISSAILVPSTRLAPTDDVLRGCPSICWMQVPYLRWRRVGATGWYHRSKLLPDVCPPFSASQSPPRLMLTREVREQAFVFVMVPDLRRHLDSPK